MIITKENITPKCTFQRIFRWAEEALARHGGTLMEIPNQGRMFPLLDPLMRNQIPTPTRWPRQGGHVRVFDAAHSAVSLKVNRRWHLSDHKLLIAAAFQTFCPETRDVACPLRCAWQGVCPPSRHRRWFISPVYFLIIDSHPPTETMLLFLAQVAIPVVSVRLVKKHKTAGLVPNGLAITTDTGQKVRHLGHIRRYCN